MTDYSLQQHIKFIRRLFGITFVAQTDRFISASAVSIMI
jgi:hypothetical protein